MHACEEGHIERVKLLLDKGANVGLIAGESKTKLNDKSVRKFTIMFTTFKDCLLCRK